MHTSEPAEPRLIQYLCVQENETGPTTETDRLTSALHQGKKENNEGNFKISTRVLLLLLLLGRIYECVLK